MKPRPPTPPHPPPSFAVDDVLFLPNPNPFSFSPPPPQRISLYHRSLRPLLSCRSLRGLLQAHAHLLISGLLRDPFAASRLLKAAITTAAAPLPYTLLLFRHLPAPDAFCANTVLKSLALSQEPLLALRFFSAHLRAGSAFPNSYTFPILFAACARSISLDAGEMCHAQAVKHRVDAVLHVRNALIHTYASCGLATSARTLFDEMPQRDEVSWNSVIDGYANLGDMATAKELFDQMPERNMVTWNVMIAGYIKWRRPELALELCRQMAKKGFKGSERTMASIITACGRLGRLKGGKSVHAHFLGNFVEENLIIETSLVDMYSRCGKVEVARKVFDQMKQRNLVCWNAMIIGHCIYGHPEDGLALFEEMVGGGYGLDNGETNDNIKRELTRILPDEITFVGVLCACARKGLLDQGKRYFEQMDQLYNLKPTFAHFWCMANLYGGLGYVDQAEEILKSKLDETDSLVLGGLLGICRFRGELELGERIAKSLIELEPNNGSRYALLHNIYIAAGKWEDAWKVKMIMKEKDIRQLPGHRLVDLNDIVHNFKVGDRSQPEIEKIYVTLDKLAARLNLRRTTTNLMNSDLL